jgi:ribosomal protein S18 acetylase RimI-like enzyme
MAIRQPNGNAMIVLDLSGSANLNSLAENHHYGSIEPDRNVMLQISEMTIADYDSVLALLSSTPGVVVRNADSREAMERYLTRNPGLSFVVRSEGRVVGCAMCGHDGRRGHLQHVAVDPAYRRRGIATRLVERCLSGLEVLGIDKTHLDVVAENESAQAFWERLGWKRRQDIVRYSFTASGDSNA